MNIDRISEKVALAGLISFLILTSIDGLVTSDSSRLIILFIRYASMIAVTLSLVFLIAVGNYFFKSFVAWFLYFSLLTWGSILAFANGASQAGVAGLFPSSLVTMCGIALFARNNGKLFSNKLSDIYVFYVFAGLVVTILAGGIDFESSPSFVFQYLSDKEDGAILYSQGISKYFGFGAVAAIFLAFNSISNARRYIAFVLAVAFIYFSLLGGARGDSILAVSVVLGYAINKNPTRLLGSILIGASIAYLFVNNWSWIDQFLVLQRLLFVTDGDFGERDILLTQSINLLTNQPECLFFGCGFGYFQDYHGYEFGMYPHNILIEMIIVFGLPVTAVIGLSIGAGVNIYYRENGKSMDIFLLFFIYSLLIGLKSGALFGDPFLTASLLYFLLLYIKNITRRISEFGIHA
jgi:hypothetical protein